MTQNVISTLGIKGDFAEKKREKEIKGWEEGKNKGSK